MPKDDTYGDWLERAVRIGTLGLGATYAAGFIVVNAYYAQYGVTDFSFVKARILAAGILFCGLAALGFLVAAGIFGVAEIRQTTFPLGDAVKAHQVLFGITFYYSAVWLVSTGIVQFILVPETSSTRHVWAEVLVLVSVAVAFSVGFFKNRRPRVALAAAAFSSTGLFIGMLYGDKTHFWVNTWLALSGAAAVPVYTKMQRSSANWKLLWDGGVVLLIIAFGFFATKIYGHVAPHFGGGHPNEVTCYLSANAPRMLGSEFHGWLLDQDEHGYYLLRSPDDHRALYVTRDIVTAVEFKAAASPIP